MNFSDEQQAEEECEAAQRVLAVFLERIVIDLIDRGPEREERRKHDDAGEDRIEAEGLIDDIGDIRAEDDECRMRDVDDVEDAERDRNSDRYRGIESAEQDARDNGIDQQLERKIHVPPAPHLFMASRPCARWA